MGENFFLSIKICKAEKYPLQITADTFDGIVYSTEARVKYTTAVVFIFQVKNHY